MTTNNALNFGTGTAGQALISNGAGAAPTFQTLPSAYASVLLNYDAYNQVINGSVGVTSVTYNVGAVYRVNLTIPFANVNYCVVGMSNTLVHAAVIVAAVVMVDNSTYPLTTSIIPLYNKNLAAAGQDTNRICIAAFAL